MKNYRVLRTFNANFAPGGLRLLDHVTFSVEPVTGQIRANRVFQTRFLSTYTQTFFFAPEDIEEVITHLRELAEISLAETEEIKEKPYVRI